MIRFSTVIFFLLIPVILFSQNAENPDTVMATGPALIKKADSDVIHVPFKLRKKLIVVKAVLNGEERSFIFDSGCQQTLLNAKYMKEEDMVQDSSARKYKGVAGTVQQASVYKHQSLDFYGIRIEDGQMHAMDLSHLEKIHKTGIHGLIGYDIMKEYDILFDYKNHCITLINPDKFDLHKAQLLNGAGSRSTGFTLTAHIPVVKAVIGDTAIYVGLDCGAGSNLIDISLFDVLKDNCRKIKRANLFGAESQSQRVSLANVKALFIAGVEFTNVPTVFSDISNLKLKIDGLIGYEILSARKTILSYARKELIFIE